MKIEEQVLSIEQMKHLQELGVDTSDASMVWNCCDNKWYILINNELTQGIVRVMKGTVSCFVPTYTIGDLIEKLPKEINSCYEGNLVIETGERSGYWWAMYRSVWGERESEYFESKSLLIVLYNMLCWVAENHKELLEVRNE